MEDVYSTELVSLGVTLTELILQIFQLKKLFLRIGRKMQEDELRVVMWLL